MPTTYPQNHYEGPVKRFTSRTALNKFLKDRDAIEEHRWKMLVEGGMHFHDHPKTKVCYQMWTDEKEGTVAAQKLLGWW